MNNERSMLLPDCGSQELREAIAQQTQDPSTCLASNLTGEIRLRKRSAAGALGAVCRRGSEEVCFLEWGSLQGPASRNREGSELAIPQKKKA